MLLSSTTTFSAHVVWKDDGSSTAIAARPAGTVTLWRYANNGQTLDASFQNELASMVVYLDDDGTENPLGFDFPVGSRDATLTAEEGHITFTYTDNNGQSQSKTINGTLPGHDGAGRLYTYFVRETLTGLSKNNYSVTYTENTDPVTSYAEGASDDGTVTNTRREKAMVTVDKTWRNPEGLDQIAGAGVQLALYATPSGASAPQALQVYSAAEGSYEILTGDDLIAARTATGFTASIPTAQKSYYVNLYDSEGLPYDMTHATLTETVKLSGSTSGIEQAGNTVTLGADTYTVTTKYVAERSDTTGEPKRYHYDQLNTITATRDYEVEKTWNLKKEASLTFKASIQAVETTLYRCLMKDLNTENPTWTTSGTIFYQMEFRAVEVHNPADDRPDGARNYEDQTDYDDEANDGHVFDPTSETAKNTSEITNRLSTLTADITADKVWYASNDTAEPGVTATFELRYRVQGATEWSSFSPALTQTLSKKANGTHDSVTWTGLPKYDRAGNELELTYYQYPDFCLTNGDVVFFTRDCTRYFRPVAVMRISEDEARDFPYHTVTELSDGAQYAAFFARCAPYADWMAAELPAYPAMLLTLSTCEYSKQNSRLVVVCACTDTQTAPEPAPEPPPEQ